MRKNHTKNSNSNLKIKDYSSRNTSNGFFYQKVLLFTIVLIIGAYSFNLNKLNFNFSADIKGLLGVDKLSSNIENIKETTASRPFKQVVNRGTVSDYQTTKYTKRNSLDDSLKTNFPDNVSSIINQYKYISFSNIYTNISNAFEREKVVFYKRLITTTWTASYNDEKLRLPDTGTHAGVDFVTSMDTPVYSIANGIVLGTKSPCPGDSCNGFGNYIVIATIFGDEIYATFYAHLDSVASSYSQGDLVKKGDLVGYVGETGNATAPHLHLQINKLGKVSDIQNLEVATSLFQGWFNDLAGVKEKTVDPIAFIESTFSTGSTSSSVSIIQKQSLTGEQSEDNTTQINPETVPETDFRLSNIVLDNLEGKIVLGDTMKATIQTTGTTGSITISVNNNVLTPSKYVISAEGKDSYEVLITASNLGNGEITFSDGFNKTTKYISVYNKSDDSQAVGINIDGPESIYKSTSQTFTVYSTDKLGNKVDTFMNGQIKITLKENSTSGSTTIEDMELTGNETYHSFDLKSPGIGTYKLSVEFTKGTQQFTAVKTLTGELFYDYSIYDDYGKDMNYLFNKGIVKGTKGNLLPENNITRAEIITILVRGKYGDDFQNFEDEMNKYIKQNGKFFSDINGDERYAPYMYIGFRDGIVKGNNGKGLPNDVITKSELITLYGRNFSVYNDDGFSYWNDVKDSDWFAQYANGAKKYNLFPFDNTTNFGGNEKTNRISAFESLYRYQTLDPAKMSGTTTTASITTTGTTTSSDNLEGLVKAVLDYN